MTPEQQAAYVIAQSASALIEAVGMMSDNLQRMRRGEALVWDNDDFSSLISKYSIGHNDVLSLYQQ